MLESKSVGLYEAFGHRSISCADYAAANFKGSVTKRNDNCYQMLPTPLIIKGVFLLGGNQLP